MRFVRNVIRFAGILGRLAEFTKKVACEFENFERLKNRDDGSDFDDSWTKLIAKARSSCSKVFAPSKFFLSNRSGARSVTPTAY